MIIGPKKGAALLVQNADQLGKQFSCTKLPAAYHKMGFHIQYLINILFQLDSQNL